MAAAAVLTAAAMMIVMTAHYIGIKTESSFCESLDCFVCIALHTAEKSYTCFKQRRLSSASDTAAYEGVYICFFKQYGQRSVSAAASI